jgi:hypothetical protein
MRELPVLAQPQESTRFTVDYLVSEQHSAVSIWDLRVYRLRFQPVAPIALTHGVPFLRSPSA